LGPDGVVPRCANDGMDAIAVHRQAPGRVGLGGAASNAAVCSSATGRARTRRGEDRNRVVGPNGPLASFDVDSDTVTGSLSTCSVSEDDVMMFGGIRSADRERQRAIPRYVAAGVDTGANRRPSGVWALVPYGRLGDRRRARDFVIANCCRHAANAGCIRCRERQRPRVAAWVPDPFSATGLEEKAAGSSRDKVWAVGFASRQRDRIQEDPARNSTTGRAFHGHAPVRTRQTRVHHGRRAIDPRRAAAIEERPAAPSGAVVEVVIAAGR
jgi:hypothetical protein